MPGRWVTIDGKRTLADELTILGHSTIWLPNVKLVDDNGDTLIQGGALKVVFAGASSGDGAILDGVAGAIRATVFNYTNSKPLAVRLTDANGDYVAPGGGAAGLTDAQLRASAVPVSAPVITKGTQGANGFTTQDLKDAGRARVSIVFQAVATATADTLLSLVKSTDGTAAAGATTIPVAANKRLRITSMTFSVKAGAAAAAFATFTVRINPAGAAVIGSQSELRVDLGNTEAVIGAARAINVPIPDGFELTGTAQLAVSAAAQATTNVLSVSLNGFEY